MKIYLLAALALSLAGCGGDLMNYQTRPGPGQAVQNPYSYASGNDEVFSRQSGAMPLVTVQFANNKDEQPKVTTIADSLSVLAGGGSVLDNAATHPASRPATQPQSTPAAETVGTVASVAIRIAGQQRPDDRFAVTPAADGAATLRVTSGMGIGNATLERIGDRWPMSISVELWYADGRKFTRLEGFTASEVTADGRKVELRSNVEKEQGRATVTVPGFSRGERIVIEWVDMYR